LKWIQAHCAREILLQTSAFIPAMYTVFAGVWEIHPPVHTPLLAVYATFVLQEFDVDPKRTVREEFYQVYEQQVKVGYSSDLCIFMHLFDS